MLLRNLNETAGTHPVPDPPQGLHVRGGRRFGQNRGVQADKCLQDIWAGLAGDTCDNDLRLRRSHELVRPPEGRNSPCGLHLRTDIGTSGDGADAGETLRQLTRQPQVEIRAPTVPHHAVTHGPTQAAGVVALRSREQLRRKRDGRSRHEATPRNYRRSFESGGGTRTPEQSTTATLRGSSAREALARV